MYDEGSPPEPEVICPLDKSHKILESRMQYHLTRCKRNHDMSEKGICTYNSTHIVGKNELQAHEAACPNRVELEVINHEEDEKRWGGIISVKCVAEKHEQSPTYGENWDDDPLVGTYDPYEATEARAVTRPLIVENPSNKKAWKQNERVRFGGLEKKPGYCKVDAPKEVQVKTGRKNPSATKTSSAASTKEKREVADQAQTEIQNLLTIDDPLLTKLQLLDLNTDNFPALQPSNSFSGAVKAAGKQQGSKKLNPK